MWIRNNTDGRYLNKSRSCISECVGNRSFVDIENDPLFAGWVLREKTWLKKIFECTGDRLESGSYSLGMDMDAYCMELAPLKMANFEVLDLYPELNLRFEIEKFRSRSHVYGALNIPQKRGFLFYGPPGTGKTTLIRDALLKLDCEYLGIFLSRCRPNNAIIASFNEDPRIKVYVLEELTETFEDPSDLLEFLDGVQALHNSIVIATTNYPEKIAENIVNRPSRFDVLREISYLDEFQVKRVLSFYLGEVESDDVKELLAKLKGVNITFAHIKEICLQMLLYDVTLSQGFDTIKENIERVQKRFKKSKLGFL